MTGPNGRVLPFGPNPGPGTLITVEGLDGAGKTTVVEALRLRLSGAGVPVLTTRLPTTEMRESRFFELLQRQGRTDLVDPVAFEVEYMVDRIQHCRTVIEPALRAGKTVVADRYALSSIGTLLLRLPALKEVALDAALRESWFANLCRYLIRPDLALVLVVDGRVGASRLRSRPGEADAGFAPREYDALQDALLGLARANGMIAIDAAGPPDATLSACLAHLERRGSAPRRTVRS